MAMLIDLCDLVVNVTVSMRAWHVLEIGYVCLYTCMVWLYMIYVVYILCVALHLKLMERVLHVSLHSLAFASKSDPFY